MAFQGAAAGGAVLLVLHRGCWELKHTRSCSIALKEACNLLFGRSWASILGKTRWKKQHRALSLFPYRKGEGEHATCCQKQVGGPFGFPLSPPSPLSPVCPNLSHAGSWAGLKRERMDLLHSCCSSEAGTKLNFAAPRTRSWGSRTELLPGTAPAPCLHPGPTTSLVP